MYKKITFSNLKKCKLNPYIAHVSGWQEIFKCLSSYSDAKLVKKRTHSLSPGGNVKFYNPSGREFGNT